MAPNTWRIFERAEFIEASRVSFGPPFVQTKFREHLDAYNRFRAKEKCTRSGIFPALAEPTPPSPITIFTVTFHPAGTSGLSVRSPIVQCATYLQSRRRFS